VSAAAGAARRALALLESRIETRRGTLALFACGVGVYALQSVALPVVPGRDFGTYLSFYVQMWDWDSVFPMSMLFRTPVAPLLVGGTLDLLGGWGAQALMAVLYAASIVAWSRTAGAFGSRAALLTAAALLVYPGYGILFHMLSSDSICAAVFAGWGLALSRAWLRPTPGRFALLGAATAAAALTRPGYQVLAVVALLPLVLPLEWRTRLVSALAVAGVVAAVLGAWAVNNGLRYDDYAVARGGAAFFPFYRALTSDRIVSPEHGEASRELARLVRRELLPNEPYRSYGVTLDDFFARGSPRMFEDAVVLSDRFRGWDSDHELLREVGVESVRAEPWRYARGVGGTVLDELWSPLHIALPARAEQPSEPVELARTPPVATALPAPTEGEQIPAARNGFFTTTPGGSIREEWTSATEHSLVFSEPGAGEHYAAIGAEVGPLAAEVPPYPGSEWLTLQLSRSSKLFPPPLLWLVAGLAGLAMRKPARAGLALAIGLAGLLVVTFQALAVYSIVEFAVPVAPALVVLGAAGLVGERRAAHPG
jgi:hypothetical protein